ncbi:hypothetical protein [Truepera radiovictrix]|jgi:ABC-type dipeptide/oligopeptide/nickel transport system permease subunit|uniref:hypothetical protein n=1 Tax=Truepera radiovictrix TaxID=332249 RepID=UPI0002DA8C0C|nr:hypothetical protein [Truepera radiovictrix]WMT58801.1 hypothetical protein RCV51_07610 [Truepera radiovictrix]
MKGFVGSSAAGTHANWGGRRAEREVGPWLLLPGLMIVVAVLAFNVVGDALRDAADAQLR